MKTNQNTEKTNVTRKLASACFAGCQKLVAQIASARKNLLAEFKETLIGQERIVHLAVNEAEALAWETDYPHLVFPALALEKVNGAAVWSRRQQLIRRPNAVYAFAA